ncbi:tetratricopeptide repeat protein [Chitinilyticum piscinae]|uniref:Tetratricopeptide repeat protein n=1 Tax=Chitinilyticum piscinae TaxID=2866724 RepID=A0A8J7FMZ8_9NEIS|nr:tetratricopeptide repeat protein [Chitinilyticum piscinae]MBE9609134.1 hypothetical protein [Chitinilyticum piscinae]
MNLDDQLRQTLEIASALILTEHAESGRLAEQALELALRLEDPDSETQARLVLARILRAHAMSERTLPAAEELIALATRRNLREVWLEGMFIAGDATFGEGMYAQSCVYYLKTLERGLAEQWPQAIATAEIGLAKIAYAYGDEAQTEKSLEQALRQAPLLNNGNLLVCLYLNLAANAIRQNRLTLGRAWLTEVQAQLLKLTDCEYEPELDYYHGIIAQREGRPQEAIAHFRRSLTLSDGINNPWGRAVNLMGLGETALTSGEYYSAEYYLQKALGLAVDIRSRHLVVEAHRMLAEALHKKGDIRREFQHWQQHFALRRSMQDENRNNPVSRAYYIEALARQAALQQRYGS